VRQLRYGMALPMRPAYPILLCLSLLVSGASIASWFFSDNAIEDRAANGDAKAEYLLGKRYFDNAMCPEDYEQAAYLVRKAAVQGYARAQAGLGLLYENGLGVPKNYSEALKWFRLAADQGSAVAQNELGVMYAKGRGVPRDLTEAANWCRLAAGQGSEVAKKNLQLAKIANARTIPQLATIENKVYRNARIKKVEPDGVTISFSPVQGGMGLAKLKVNNLPSELRELCTYATREGADSESAYSHIGGVRATL